MQFPNQGLNLGPLHWEYRVLAPGPPGKPHLCLNCEGGFTFFSVSMDVRDLRCGPFSLHRDLVCTQPWGQRIWTSASKPFMQKNIHAVLPRLALLSFQIIILWSRLSHLKEYLSLCQHSTDLSSGLCSSFLLRFQDKSILSAPCLFPLAASLRSLLVYVPGIHPGTGPSAMPLPCQ